jgi:hypothetical protein
MPSMKKDENGITIKIRIRIKRVGMDFGLEGE